MLSMMDLNVEQQIKAGDRDEHKGVSRNAQSPQSLFFFFFVIKQCRPYPTGTRKPSEAGHSILAHSSQYLHNYSRG